MRITQVFRGRIAAAGLTLAVLTANTTRAVPPEGAAGTGARAFVIVDDKTGHVLAGSHVADKLQIASLTKIATAVVVLDWVRLGGHTLDEAVTIPPFAGSIGEDR